MTTTSTSAPAQRDYETRLRRELAVLPRRARRELLQDFSDHAADAADTADQQGFADSFGAPPLIAAAALEARDARAGRPVRPSLLLPSKALQLWAAIIASPLAVFALVDLVNGNALLGLLRAVPWALIALPPLLARWPAWWRTSIVCVILHLVYLGVALTIALGGWSVPAVGVPFLLSGPVAATQVLALALSIIGLVRAPEVLRRG